MAPARRRRVLPRLRTGCGRSGWPAIVEGSEMISPDIGMASDNIRSQEPTTLPQVIATALPPAIKLDLDDAVSFARAEKAPATRRAYQSDFEQFRAWCEGKDVLA